MFLKSLTLRGFKSFADKVSLKLEPGITAVVGPNGSGKSNISDAVLWVLGERNVKNLRGQAMEDVIFAGSSARKATSVAEVELVLDNSDGTLPVEFSEVSIARRVYRSGESEYLINGVVARRMDVLEILHDTGLGTGTHSIISQGSLDSVLQSKPEDRRALVEEAAGVLKHKQRMAKSARKLERMQAHVDRVSDIASEVGRQLGPLERKAKRALQYAELSKELASLRLVLAVDDLRTLKAEHARISERERMAQDACEQGKKRNEELDSQISALQEKIREDSVGASELSRTYQQTTAAAERLDSTALLLRDRRRAALARASELEVRKEQLKASVERAHTKLAEAQKQATADSTASKEATQMVKQLQEEFDSLSARYTEEERKAKELSTLITSLDNESVQVRNNLAQAKEALTNSMAHIKVIEGHKTELNLQIERLSADANVALTEAQTVEEALAALDAQDKNARTLVSTCMQAREEARKAADTASAQEQSLEAQVQALEEIEAAEGMSAESGSHKAAAALTQAGSHHTLLSHAVKAPQELEALVEALLGSDLSALVVPKTADIHTANSALGSHDGGSVTLLLQEDTSSVRQSLKNYAKLTPPSGSLLLDKLEIAPEYTEAIQALLADVVLCETLSDALSGHAADTQGFRFATAEGDIVYPTGKTDLHAHAKGSDAGVLSRLRRIEELKAALVDAKKATATAASDAKSAEDALLRAQTESLALKEKLAMLKGNAQSARQAADDASQKLSSALREMEQLEESLSKASSTAESARPTIQQYETRLTEIAQSLEEAKVNSANIAEELEPLQDRKLGVSAQLSEARLQAAKLAERNTYSSRVIEGALTELESLQTAQSEDAYLYEVKRASAARLEPLYELLSHIAAAARNAMKTLEDASSSAKNSTNDLHEQLKQLHDQARSAQDAYDKSAEQLASVRVEKTKAEMQVQAAVAVITEDCKENLEKALLLPAPENRALAEEESFRLTRRIANLGTINPDAAEEYEELKSRYDYLESQLSDMRAANRALVRINAVIEERMKDDFIRTFEVVNENFQEIFAVLFPGGSAHLSLDTPDDLENSGVEVNAQPAGKRITKMSLMSGGEKSLTALALLFALYKTRATPFYILDEVEAALDDSNLRRLVGFIQRMRTETQLIMITHQRRTMEMADVLFGVSMQADGVTKVLSQKLEDALRS